MPGPLHRDLYELKSLLLEMNERVGEQLRRATQALLQGDRAQAQHAAALDADIDALERCVDDACMRLLGRHRPTARDLRFIAAAMKTVTELERIGDQAATVAGSVLGPEIPPELVDGGLERMARLALGMVLDSVDALVRADADLARRAIAAGAALEPLEQHVVRRLLSHAARAPARTRAVFRLAYAARCLERIGEHANGIAQTAIYVAEGLMEDHAGA